MLRVSLESTFPFYIILIICCYCFHMSDDQTAPLMYGRVFVLFCYYVHEFESQCKCLIYIDDFDNESKVTQSVFIVQQCSMTGRYFFLIIIIFGIFSKQWIWQAIRRGRLTPSLYFGNVFCEHEYTVRIMYIMMNCKNCLYRFRYNFSRFRNIIRV